MSIARRAPSRSTSDARTDQRDTRAEHRRPPAPRRARTGSGRTRRCSSGPIAGSPKLTSETAACAPDAPTSTAPGAARVSPVTRRDYPWRVDRDAVARAGPARPGARRRSPSSASARRRSARRSPRSSSRRRAGRVDADAFARSTRTTSSPCPRGPGRASTTTARRTRTSRSDDPTSRSTTTTTSRGDELARLRRDRRSQRIQGRSSATSPPSTARRRPLPGATSTRPRSGAQRGSGRATLGTAAPLSPAAAPRRTASAPRSRRAA